MTRSRTLTRYWDARLDPLNWREPREGAVPSVAGLAVDAFATPDTRAALDLLGDLRGEAVLELACGHGAGAQELTRRGARAVGLDISPRRCAVAAAGASGAQFCAGDAQKLPFADGAFDAIFARDILMYADTSTVARECARVLRPAGRAVFVESLAGHALLRAWRRVTTPREYRAFTRHLSWNDLRALPAPLRLEAARAFHLFGQAAFAALFVLRSGALHRGLLRAAAPFDRQLLARFPALAAVAWRGVAVYRRESRGV